MKLRTFDICGFFMLFLVLMEAHWASSDIPFCIHQLNVQREQMGCRPVLLASIGKIGRGRTEREEASL